MSSAAHRFLDEYSKLSEQDRAIVRAELRLGSSTDSEEDVANAWADEVDRRLDAVDSGEAELIDGHEVSRRIRAKHPR